MKSELRELYQELILDHGRKPRNHRIIEHPTGEAEGHNPLCGDKCHVYVNVENDHLADVSFKGMGCAISQASASLMTQAVKNLSREETELLFNRFQQMIKDEAPDMDVESVGKLASLSGVKEFPSRVKCAMLPWHTLIAALKNSSDTVTTE